MNDVKNNFDNAPKNTDKEQMDRRNEADPQKKNDPFPANANNTNDTTVKK